jgi:hypothetical protein
MHRAVCLASHFDADVIMSILSWHKEGKCLWPCRTKPAWRILQTGPLQAVVNWMDYVLCFDAPNS